MFSTLPTRWWCIGLLAAFGAAVPASAADVLIAHPETAIDRIDHDSLRALFQGRKRALPNGQRVDLVVLAGGPVHERFLADHVHMTEAQFQTHWKKLVFIGQGRLPRSVASEADMVKLIAATKGTVGYIDAATPHDGVKVLVISD
ncbi:MAG: hypothetical protein H0W72_09195 [Planctomycetes bacterium]|nr:hypothetical protein [Planctomycetota bacterium]